MWKHMSDAYKRKIEKPKLDDARRLRGIYFIDPKGDEFKDIMKNASRKFEIPMPAAMSFKTPMCQVAGKPAAMLENTRQNTLILSKLTNLWEYEWKELLTEIMKIILQEKAWCLMQWKYWMQRQQLKNWASCEGQAADAVSAYTQVKMEDAPSLLKIPKSECPDIWIRLPRHKIAQIMVQYGRSSRSSWAKSVRSSFSRTVMGKAIRESSIRTRSGKSSKMGMFIRQPRKKDYSSLCMWTTLNWLDTNRNINPTWTILMREVDLGEPTSFLDHVYLGCTQRECQISKDIVDNNKNMFESRISARAVENYQKQEFQGNLMRTLFLHGPMIWKVMQRSAWKDTASWRIKTKQRWHKSRNAMPWWPPIWRRRRNRISWRIVNSLLTNCSVMSILGSYW